MKFSDRFREFGDRSCIDACRSEAVIAAPNKLVPNEVNELVGYALNDAFPISRLGLPEKSHGRVPGTIVTVQEPTPVRNIGKQSPNRFVQSAGEMNNRGVG